MATLGRYAIPLEDVLILIDGKDFDGIEQSQLEAGIWLVAGLVPGSKVLKPIAKITKAGLAISAKVLKVGGKTIQLTYKKVGNLIEFGGRSRFREIVGAVTGEEAHHIIPWAQRVNEVIQKAAEWGFHMNDRINGISLEKFFQGIGGLHGNHPEYNKYVLSKLEEWRKLNPEFNGSEAIESLEQQLIPELLQLIDLAKNSGLSLNEFFKTQL